jgi:LAS superfamily LD-carboxypeptidase LdcB
MKWSFTFLLFLCALFAVSQSRTFSKEELLGKLEPAKDADFVKIEMKYTTKENIYLRKEVYAQMTAMIDAAAKDGVKLVVISATRNFNYQKGIWENKWNNKTNKSASNVERARSIMRYSAMPGASRHHWGTDVDFNSVTPDYFTKGEGKKIYDWLKANGSKYGFAQTYTSKSAGRKGYEEEFWHWSYMPLAEQMLSAYNSQITYSDFAGFSGSEAAKELRVIEDFVNGISH